MPDLTSYHLEFPGGLHLGTSGTDLEDSTFTLPSDTLFSAWVDAGRRLGLDPSALAAPFAASPPRPPFLLTSAFPRAGSLRFYPVPVDLSRLLSLETIRKADKSVRRIRYFSEGLLRRALAGERLDALLFPLDPAVEPDRGAALNNGTLWFALDELEALPAAFRLPVGRRHALRRLPVWSEQRVPRVTVDRVNSSSTIFHAGKVTFSQGCGLWFGAQWLQPDRVPAQQGPTFRQAFERGLDALRMDGLGGERSLGYGAFEILETHLVSLGKDPRPGDVLYLLNRYHPRRDELPAALADRRAAYALTVVGGWLRSMDGPAQRRKNLRLVSEGSLVCPPAFPAGDLCDVRPDYDNPAGMPQHPVYRSGIALGLAWPEKEAQHA